LPQGGNYAALIALFYFFFSFCSQVVKVFLGKNHSSIFKNSKSETIWGKKS